MQNMPMQEPERKDAQWFVMRDFSQTQSSFAYARFEAAGFRTFTPLCWRLSGRGAGRERVLAPFIRDLFFVCAVKPDLDPFVEREPSVTYRYVRGGFHSPMTVPCAEMERFVRAVSRARFPEYYRPDEVTPSLYGRRVRIVGGGLDGYEGLLVRSRNGRKGIRLLVELPGFFSVGVEVRAKYVVPL